jgi:hypothetical protein
MALKIVPFYQNLDEKYIEYIVDIFFFLFSTHLYLIVLCFQGE